ncbi:unnamed protein product [Durusdinium trenchii]|uniref:Uncharacterized protein n=1 Tax=Durusdinium trenchii TaxID=1381693 RepID=A0ABP0MP27_9DINO
MCDPHFKTLTWDPSCATLDSKKKRNMEFLTECYTLYRQVFDQPDRKVFPEIPVPTKRQKKDIADSKNLFNRFQVQTSSGFASDSNLIAVPTVSDVGVEKAWASFKVELKTKVYSYWFVWSPPIMMRSVGGRRRAESSFPWCFHVPDTF